MRFAIALLTLIAIASVIGTVLKQQEPFSNYVNQFGPFWASLYQSLGLFEVYTSWWFLTILAFLVISVSLCLMRNVPKMLADIATWKEHVQEGGLRALHHHFDFSVKASHTETANQISDRLVNAGYAVKQKRSANDTLILAKKGSANKWGYILAHSAIILICLGGLLDGDLPTKAQIWWGGKTYLPASLENAPLSQIPSQYRLSIDNPSYRANLFIPEGQQSSIAYINSAKGGLLQELPFAIRLKEFKVDYYSTGMPKLFSSAVVVTDLKTGKQQEAIIKVNEPLIIDGAAIYQSSFEDGGSKVTLAPVFLNAPALKINHLLSSEVGSSASLKEYFGQDYRIEVTGFKMINVENITNADGKVDARGVSRTGLESFTHSLDQRLGSGAKTSNQKEMRNVGPSVQYKIRDTSGQAKEFSNYMLPLKIDGQSFYLAGVRDTPSEPFRYLRIPAGEKDSLDEWLTMKSLLNDPVARDLAVKRFAAKAFKGMKGTAENQDIKGQLEKSASRALEVFALGDGKGGLGGLSGMSDFIEKAVPEQGRAQAAEVILKLLDGCVYEIWQQARAKLGLPEQKESPSSEKFIQASIGALSDSWFYPLPVIFQLKEFSEVKASVFQVTRSPGKKWVYVGCLLLVLGIFAMFYLPERRIWVKLSGQDLAKGLFAMTTTRHTLDFENEYTHYKKEFETWTLN